MERRGEEQPHECPVGVARAVGRRPVSGSVSMTKAKKKNGEYRNKVLKAWPIAWPPARRGQAGDHHRCGHEAPDEPEAPDLRVTSSPPTSTKGSMVALPIHHEAAWLMAR